LLLLLRTEAVRCRQLRAPAKTSLDCITHPVSGGSEIVRCELSCRGASRFSAASVGGHWTTATQCGAHTGYRWTHEIQNISLLACSGILLLLLTLPYLTFGVGRLLHLPSAEAVSVWPNAQPRCNQKVTVRPKSAVKPNKSPATWDW